MGAGRFSNQINNMRTKRTHTEEDPGPDMNMAQMVKWSLRESKKQAIFAELRRRTSWDMYLSAIAIILAIMDIEQENLAGQRFYNDMIIPSIWQTPVAATNGSQYYDQLRPVCWLKLYDFGYITPEGYDNLVLKLRDEFDVNNEVSAVRFIDQETLFGFTQAWTKGGHGHNYTTGSDFVFVDKATNSVRAQMPTNACQAILRLCITLITIYQIFQRRAYHIAREGLYISQNTFGVKKTWRHYIPRYLEYFLLILHLPPFFTHLLNANARMLITITTALRLIHSNLLRAENSRQSQLIESTVKETLLLERMQNSMFSNRRSNTDILKEFAVYLVYCAYILYAFERKFGMCISFGSSVWLVFSACTNLGMVMAAMPKHPMSVSLIFFWSGFGVVLWALVIDWVSRKRILEPESRKIVASYEQKRAHVILKDNAASVIQAVWKCYKSRSYLKWQDELKQKLANAERLKPDAVPSTVSQKEEREKGFGCTCMPGTCDCMLLDDDIIVALKNKIWLFKKVRRELKIVCNSLERELAMDDQSRTLDDHVAMIRALEKLSKKAIEPIRYQDGNDWDDFREYWGQQMPQKPSGMKAMQRTFKKGLKTIKSGTGISKKNKGSKSYTAAGFKALEVNAKLGISCEELDGITSSASGVGAGKRRASMDKQAPVMKKMSAVEAAPIFEEEAEDTHEKMDRLTAQMKALERRLSSFSAPDLFNKDDEEED